MIIASESPLHGMYNVETLEKYGWKRIKQSEWYPDSYYMRFDIPQKYLIEGSSTAEIEERIMASVNLLKVGDTSVAESLLADMILSGGDTNNIIPEGEVNEEEGEEPEDDVDDELEDVADDDPDDADDDDDDDFDDDDEA